MKKFRHKKSLGQNFLHDKNIINKIVSASELNERTLVIEIGPGEGALTEELLKAAGKVVAVEIDKDLIPILEDRFGRKVQVINADILKIDLRKLIDNSNGGFDKIMVIGNLPYYITSPIIMKIMESGVEIDELMFMMQKEVAERIISAPGCKEYGAISVAVQYYSEVEKVMNVSREVFIPKPNVDSCVVRFKIRSKPAVAVKSEKLFFAVVKAGFAQRRKTLLNALSSVWSKDILREVFTAVEIDSMRRAETLSLQEFASISDAVEDRI